MKTIVIGNDHAAVQMKHDIVDYLKSKQYNVFDVGVNTPDSVDYPVIALKVAEMINENKAECGILICGTGIGMSIAANKIKNIRAACVSESLSAKLSREHNDSNIICFGARIIGIETAKEIVDTFLNTEFSGNRHKKRVDMIKEIETNGSLNV